MDSGRDIFGAPDEAVAAKVAMIVRVLGRARIESLEGARLGTL
jgi:hypothetical protein